MDVEVAALTGSALVGPPRHLDEDKASRYAQILDQLPPVVVFESDDGLLLVDGYRRMEAARRLGGQWSGRRCGRDPVRTRCDSRWISRPPNAGCPKTRRSMRSGAGAGNAGVRDKARRSRGGPGHAGGLQAIQGGPMGFNHVGRSAGRRSSSCRSITGPARICRRSSRCLRVRSVHRIATDWLDRSQRLVATHRTSSLRGRVLPDRLPGW
jgi:hypothetical protein